MALPAFVASSVPCGGNSASNPAAPSLSSSGNSKLQVQVLSGTSGVFPSPVGVASNNWGGGQERADLPWGSQQYQSQFLGRAQVQEDIQESDLVTQVVGVDPAQDCHGAVAIKRKKSTEMAVRNAGDAEASPSNADLVVDGKADSDVLVKEAKGPCLRRKEEAASVGTQDQCVMPDERHFPITAAVHHDEKLQQQQPDPRQHEPAQGTLAALRGYFLSTSGKLVFAVGGFGVRHSSPGNGLQGHSSIPVAAGGTPRPAMLRGRTSSFERGPHGASHGSVSRGFHGQSQDPGAWWSESSEDEAVGIGGQAAPESLRGAVGNSGSNEVGDGAAENSGVSVVPSVARGPAPDPSQFVNEALLRWEERRAAWRAGARPVPLHGQDNQRTTGLHGDQGIHLRQSPSNERASSVPGPPSSGGRGDHPRLRHKNSSKPVEAKIRPGTTYEDLLSSTRPFPEPVPLPEMVEFLVDIWREEGLYD